MSDFTTVVNKKKESAYKKAPSNDGLKPNTKRPDNEIFLLSDEKNICRWAFGLETNHKQYQTFSKKPRTDFEIMTEIRTKFSSNNMDSKKKALYCCFLCTKDDRNLLLLEIMKFINKQFGLSDSDIMNTTLHTDGYTIITYACWDLAPNCLLVCASKGGNVNFVSRTGESLEQTIDNGIRHRLNIRTDNFNGTRMNTVKTKAEDNAFKCKNDLQRYRQAQKMMKEEEEMKKLEAIPENSVSDDLKEEASDPNLNLKVGEPDTVIDTVTDDLNNLKVGEEQAEQVIDESSEHDQKPDSIENESHDDVDFSMISSDPNDAFAPVRKQKKKRDRRNKAKQFQARYFSDKDVANKNSSRVEIAFLKICSLCVSNTKSLETKVYDEILHYRGIFSSSYEDLKEFNALLNEKFNL